MAVLYTNPSLNEVYYGIKGLLGINVTNMSFRFLPMTTLNM